MRAWGNCVLVVHFLDKALPFKKSIDMLLVTQYSDRCFTSWSLCPEGFGTGWSHTELEHLNLVNPRWSDWLSQLQPFQQEQTRHSFRRNQRSWVGVVSWVPYRCST
jgi:hypothetical protein